MIDHVRITKETAKTITLEKIEILRRRYQRTGTMFTDNSPEAQKLQKQIQS